MAYPIRWDEIAAPVESETSVCGQPERNPSSPAYFRRLIILTLLGSALLCFAVIAVTTFLLSDRQSPGLRLESGPASGLLTSCAPTAVRRLGFVTVTGVVVNRSSDSQSHIEAIVDLLDGKRKTLSSQSAMIQRESVAPGQQSSFRLEMADNPSAAAYRIRFRKLNSIDLN
jgi:hypothetical protein